LAFELKIGQRVVFSIDATDSRGPRAADIRELDADAVRELGVRAPRPGFGLG
jgi:hypothetical protein